jgi:hypothetical protein
VTTIGPKQMLLERMWREKEDADLAETVAAALRQGASWRKIADVVSETTGLRVSHEALRQWYGRQESPTP